MTAREKFPFLYQLLDGNAADVSTVQANMQRLLQVLQERGWPCGIVPIPQGWPVKAVLVVGDRAMLSAEIVLAYHRANLKYLGALKVMGEKEEALIRSVSEAELRAHPLDDDHWGVKRPYAFEHKGESVTDVALVTLSRSLRRRQRDHRQSDFGFRISRRPYPKFAIRNPQSEIPLITNDPTLSGAEMVTRYGEKDKVEKKFRVLKGPIRVRPIFLHKEERIEALIFVNMLALLVYSVLEMKCRRYGLQVTAEKVLKGFAYLAAVYTRFRDGSIQLRVEELNRFQQGVVQALGSAWWPSWPGGLLPLAASDQTVVTPPGWEKIPIVQPD